jgi:hypothetical protein
VGSALLCLFGGFAVVVGVGQGWCMPHALRVGDDGVLQVVRPFRTARVPISSIRAVDKVLAKVGVEGADPHEVRIRHAAGTVPVAYFAEVEHFIADLRARNPSIAVQEGWRAGEGGGHRA